MNEKDLLLAVTTDACYDNYICQTEHWSEWVGQYYVEQGTIAGNKKLEVQFKDKPVIKCVLNKI